MSSTDTPDPTSGPLSGIEVRVSCPYCPPPGMVPRSLVSLHMASEHPAEPPLEPASTPLREHIATAVRSVLYQDLPGDMGDHVADAVLAALLTSSGIATALEGMSGADVRRVTALYERWVKAGPPPLGTPLARWWDKRLAELHKALPTSAGTD